MTLVLFSQKIMKRSLIRNRLGLSKEQTGITTPPAGYEATCFRMVIDKTNDRQAYTVLIIKDKKCSPGTNESFYLGEGIYTMGQSNFDGDFGDPEPGTRRAKMMISHEIARINEQCENEHCRDIIHAYHITLLAADRTVDQVAAGLLHEKNLGMQYRSVNEAARAVKVKLGLKSSHQKIADIFDQSIRDDGTVSQSFKHDMEALYKRTFELTNQRDIDRNGGSWHRFIVSREEYRPCFASCRGYHLDEYSYHKLKLPQPLADGNTPPSTMALIRL